MHHHLCPLLSYDTHTMIGVLFTLISHKLAKRGRKEIPLVLLLSIRSRLRIGGQSFFQNDGDDDAVLSVLRPISSSTTVETGFNKNEEWIRWQAAAAAALVPARLGPDCGRHTREQGERDTLTETGPHVSILYFGTRVSYFVCVAVHYGELAVVAHRTSRGLDRRLGTDA